MFFVSSSNSVSSRVLFIVGTKYSQLMANKTKFTMLRATPVIFMNNPQVMADKSEMKRPEANSLGNIARTISAAFL